MSHDAIHIGIDLSADEKNRVDQIAAKSGIYQLLARAGVGERQADQLTAERLGPKIGDTVRFRDANGRQQIGVVCDPNDPAKTGTYTSPSAGVISYRADTRNRKQRRIAQAQAR